LVCSELKKNSETYIMLTILSNKIVELVFTMNH